MGRKPAEEILSATSIWEGPTGLSQIDPIEVIAMPLERSPEDTASAELPDFEADLDAVALLSVASVFVLSELVSDFASATDSSFFAVVRVRPRRLLGSALVMRHFLALFQQSASVATACG